jgi:hypothetical protein
MQDTGKFEWLLYAPLKAARFGDVYCFVRTSDTGRILAQTATLHVRPTKEGGRMLFNGNDMETEDFMSYVGLCDMVDDGYTDIPPDTDAEM